MDNIIFFIVYFECIFVIILYIYGVVNCYRMDVILILVFFFLNILLKFVGYFFIRYLIYMM